MSIIKVDYTEIDNKAPKLSLEPDVNNLINQITAKGISWTASEDCILVGQCVGTSSAWAHVYYNTTNNNAGDAYALIKTSGTATFGVDTNTDPVPNFGLLIPKGTIITTRNGGTSYDLKFYKIK